ncbi:hypothetical protein D3C74_437990 [compost metagenome]
MGKQRDRDQNEHGGAANQRGGVPALQIQREHRRYIKQKEQGYGNSEPLAETGSQQNRRFFSPFGIRSP